MNIEISTRLYNNIVSYCQANALEPLKYIEKTLCERLATDKYGDLNERLQKEVIIETKTVVEEPKPTETEPTAEAIIPIKPQETNSKEESEENETSVSETVVSEEPVEKKVKRTLRTK